MGTFSTFTLELWYKLWGQRSHYLVYIYLHLLLLVLTSSPTRLIESLVGKVSGYCHNRSKGELWIGKCVLQPSFMARYFCKTEMLTQMDRRFLYSQDSPTLISGYVCTTAFCTSFFSAAGSSAILSNIFSQLCFSAKTFLVTEVKDIFSFSYQKLLLSNCTCALY